MKMILSGGGGVAKNQEAYDLFAANVDKRKPVLYIRFAALPDDYTTAYGKFAASMAELGIYSTRLCESPEVFSEFDLSEFGGIFCSGGNTFRLLKTLKDCGADKKIKEYLKNGGTYIGSSAGAIIGTSTTTTFVESSSGVAEGGRTGLSSVVTGLLFLVAIVFAPVFTTIPGFATAPALIFVGFLMISAVVEIDFNDFTESIPAYLCLICMPLMYSISEGIAVGVISYVVINLVCGKYKKITPLMYILAVLFVLKYIFL